MRRLYLLFVCVFSFFVHASFYANETNEKGFKSKILVGSPIRQTPEVLKEFLASLENVEKTSFQFDYYFVDDNTDPKSSEALREFALKNEGRCIIKDPKASKEDGYNSNNEVTHVWSNAAIWKVGAFKDSIIEHAKAKEYDYLFLIDSDLVLHPKTIEQLIADKKGIVCNIFWTAWTPGTCEMPQVWVQDEYNFFEKDGQTSPSEEVQNQSFYEFIAMLRNPGVYEVGGMGACTLINRETLLKGVSFKKIKNLSFWGEDRHFCIRAAALDIPMYVDTHYPAYHIYRPSALSGVEAFKKEANKKPPKITLSMIVKNEASRYLRPVLESAKEYITDAVIIDDGSTDDSVAVCEEVLKDIPLKLVRNEQSKFAKEYSLRKQQWEETVKTNPEWILILDSDEIFEDSFKDQVKHMVADDKVNSYLFRLYDFWDSDHYRDDQYWSAHYHFYPFLVRYNEALSYSFQQKDQHCGRFPIEVYAYSNQVVSPLRLKHYGWSKKEDREAKYKRYQQLDPEARFGWKEQYDSILDESPNLVTWQEKEG